MNFLPDPLGINCTPTKSLENPLEMNQIPYQILLEAIKFLIKFCRNQLNRCQIKRGPLENQWDS